MRVEHVVEAEAFRDAARSILLADEARHNLPLGLLSTVERHPEVYPEFHGWIVSDDPSAAPDAARPPAGAAMRTPPHNLILVRSTPDAIEALARAIDAELPGVVGAVPEVDVFASAWSALHSVDLETRFEQRIYRLRALRPMSTPPGRMRLATTDDREVVLERFRAFGEEVQHGPDESADEDRLARVVENRLSASEAGVALWEVDSEIASLAGFGGPTPNGIRVGPVHTPPALRGRGYGTAVTAGVSRLLLERGHRFCFLYTDLANPTSNAIYVRIGYEPVCDSREISFAPRTTG